MALRSILLKAWDDVRSSFWFVPATMACGAIALALAAIRFDEMSGEQWLIGWGFGYTGGAEGASQLLSTVAGSMITIAGTVFSMTLVVLSLASSQLGPRLLRNFMRDTTNQSVLGTFVATFMYCLVVLRSIRHGEESAFVPHLSVSVGVLMAMISLGVLIYFIHHVSLSIQADEVVARVGRELTESIDDLCPPVAADTPSPALPCTELPLAFDREARTVDCTLDGYVQIVDREALIEIACEGDLLIRLERRAGHYAAQGQALAAAWPGDRIDDAIAERINKAFVIGKQRTAAQDIEFSVDQLVEIAVRALSPGINDPFTAIVCVDRLGSALSRLVQRRMPSPFLHDPHGRLRVIEQCTTFRGFVDAAFNQIRQSAATNAAVSMRLLESIAVIGRAARHDEDRAVLLNHAQMVVRAARQNLPEAADRQAVEERFSLAREALTAVPPLAAAG